MARQQATKRAQKRGASPKKKGSAKHKEEVNKVKNAQSWSIDLIVGVIIFMLIIAVFYALLTSRTEQKIEDLESDSRAALSKLRGGDAASYGIIKDGVVDQELFDDLCSRPYSEVKSILGIESDVCIYLEDEAGNIIPCGTDMNRVGIGNEQDITIADGLRCGEVMS